MDLSTTYLGLDLRHPFLNGASPLTQSLDTVKRLEDAGAAAIVVHSLFEEQVAELRADASARRMIDPLDPAAPSNEALAADPYEHLEQVRRIRGAVGVPVIASLNGTTLGGWLHWAKLLEQAGANAIELNVYEVATDPRATAADVERRVLEIVRAVSSEIGVPLAVKLSPFYSAFANLAARLDAAGAKGLVLFNRFFQPDIDLHARAVRPRISYSRREELPLRLRWLAILDGRVGCSLAVSGGVHETADAAKAVLAGAHAIQMVSALLVNGPEHLRVVREGFARWLAERGVHSLGAIRGEMSLAQCADPKGFERAAYTGTIRGWSPVE